MTRSRFLPLASMTAVALLVAACGGDDDASDTTETTEAAVDTTDAPATTEAAASTVPDTTEGPTTTEAPATTEAAASTVPDTTTGGTGPASSAPSGSVPAGEPTAPGTALAYGEPAVVALEEEAPDQLLQLVVQQPEQGTAEQLDELQVNDVTPGSSLHFVTLEVTNISAEPTGGDYLPNSSFQLLVLQDDGQPALPIINFVDFVPCDEEDPDDLAVGESFTTCLTYLAAPDTTITGVNYAQSLTSDPITWT